MFDSTLIRQNNLYTWIKKRQFTQPLFKCFKEKIAVTECIQTSKEPHFGTLAAICGAFDTQTFSGKATFKTRVVLFIIPPNTQFKVIRQRINNRHTHAVQTTRDLIRIIIKFTTGMQLCHNNFSRRNTFFFVHINRDTTTVITNRHRPIIVNDHINMVGMTGQSLVNAIVNDFIDHVMQARPIVRVTNIHTRALANSF